MRRHDFSMDATLKNGCAQLTKGFASLSEISL